MTTSLTVEEHQTREQNFDERLLAIEAKYAEDNLKLSFDYEADELEAEGTDESIAAALAEMPREDLVEAVKRRQGPPPPRKKVKVRIGGKVLAKSVYRQNYRRWYMGMPTYHRPSPEQEELMFSVIEEGWEVLFDFAHSVTCRLPDGRLISVNRKGKIEAPSIYSPHLPRPVSE